MKIHIHSWELICRDAIGRFEKQEGQKNPFYCHGRIEGCSICPALRLVPHDSVFRPVEVERAAA